MKKICLVTYYELKEALLLSAEALRKYGYTVINFPLFQYCFDVNDKRDDYIEYFNAFLEKENPDVVLWWCHSMRSADDFELLINNHLTKMNIMYNWDDPHCWKVTENFMPTKTKNLDVAFSCCMAAKPLYEKAGCSKFVYLPPGFDPTTHYPVDPDPELCCDVSMCVTNVYSKDHYPDQYIERKSIMDALEASPDINFHVYGPDFLKELYPRSYKRPLKYEETAKLFSSSKINISTHVMHNQDMYINERCNLVLACKGLLMVDPIKGIEKVYDVNNHIVLLEKDYLAQIRHILKNYGEYEPRRQKGYDFVMKNYTWERWAFTIHREIGLYFLEKEEYDQIHSHFSLRTLQSYSLLFGNHDEKKEEEEKEEKEKKSFEDVKKVFIECMEKDIVAFPFSFKVPSNFSASEYYERNIQYFKKVEQRTEPFGDEFSAFVHWKLLGTTKKLKPGFIIASVKNRGIDDSNNNASSSSSSMMISVAPVTPFTTTKIEFDLFSILSSIYNDSIDSANNNKNPRDLLQNKDVLKRKWLKTLSDFSQQNPMVPIDAVVEKYFSLIDYPTFEDEN